MSFIPSQVLAQGAFGSLSTFNDTPLVQITAQYGLLDDVLVAASGGTVTTADSKFIASTGVGANNVAAIISAREAQYRAGQGLTCRLTSIFTAGVANSAQQAGFITSESAFAFGYNGADFGILHAKDGALEQQVLTITSGAGGSENATVTIDGTPYVVPITAGTPQRNAYEIAINLDAAVPVFGFTSNGDTVICLGQLPDFGAGSFAFSSATAVAAWVEVQAATLPTEVWVNKADWNVNPDINIDPTLGNVYQIQVQYLGFGGIRFYVENPETAELEVVHIIKYANSATVPSVTNPIFRVGWACRNTGNTSDIVVSGASGSAFIEGVIVLDGKPRGDCHTQLAVGTTRTNIQTIRNRRTFNGTANRAEMVLQTLSLATDTSKVAFFELVVNPEVAPADFLSFSYFDEATSLLEEATDNVAITGGDVVACYSVVAGSSPIIDLTKIFRGLSPGDTLSIAADVSSGAAAEMDISLVWKDDL